MHINVCNLINFEIATREILHQRYCIFKIKCFYKYLSASLIYLILKNAFDASPVFSRINWINMEISAYSLRLEFWSSFMEKLKQQLHDAIYRLRFKLVDSYLIAFKFAQ